MRQTKDSLFEHNDSADERQNPLPQWLRTSLFASCSFTYNLKVFISASLMSSLAPLTAHDARRRVGDVEDKYRTNRGLVETVGENT